MKRFWTDVGVVADADGHAIRLDGRPVRTPGRLALIVPTPALAEAIAEEWRAVTGEIDPRAMRLTGLANAAVERIAPNPRGFADGLANYAETDLLCYRADNPASLVSRQAAVWDPLLDWAAGRYDIGFTLATGIIHRPQPPVTVERLADAIRARDAFRLAALSPIITIGGSLVTALALDEGVIDAESAWNATHLDELWQEEQWGEDELATRARAARRGDFDAAARFLALV